MALMGTYETYYKPIDYDYTHSDKQKQRGHDPRCTSQPKCVILGNGQLNMMLEGVMKVATQRKLKTFCWTLFSKQVK
jgi:anti-sigma factor ChrR (cupin superfamily)